jgi:protein O-GlcNAc transferase
MEKQSLHFEYKNTTIKLITWKDHIGKIIRSSGKFYEAPMLDYICKLQPRGTIIDVGANIGNHSIYFGHFLSNKIVAIEPVPENFAILCANVSINHMEDRIVSHQIGASIKHHRLSVSYDPINMGMCKLSTLISDKRNVECYSLDVYVGCNDIGLIKIDCEGMELKALQGAEKILRRCKPLLFVEAATEQEFNQVNEYLIPLGYTMIKQFNATPTYYFKHGNI